MSALPSSFVEALNGALMIILFYAIVFDALYLRAKWIQAGATLALSGRVLLMATYYECKGAIALLVMLIGFDLRTGLLWLLRHAENRGGDVAQYRAQAMVLLAVATAISIWGALCWIKVVAPFKHSRGMWLAMTAFAVCFGVFMAA